MNTIPSNPINYRIKDSGSHSQPPVINYEQSKSSKNMDILSASFSMSGSFGINSENFSSEALLSKSLRYEISISISMDVDMHTEMHPVDEQSYIEEPENEGFDSSAVADSVLSFLQASFSSFSAQGIDQDRMESKVNAAKEGVLKGVAEARDILDALDMMTPDIDVGIKDAVSLIMEGIQILEEQFLLDGEPSKD